MTFPQVKRWNNKHFLDQSILHSNLLNLSTYYFCSIADPGLEREKEQFFELQILHEVT